MAPKTALLDQSRPAMEKSPIAPLNLVCGLEVTVDQPFGAWQVVRHKLGEVAADLLGVGVEAEEGRQS